MFSSVYGETLHWNKGRGYDPFNYATADGVLMDNTSDTLIYDYYTLSGATKEFDLKFRSKNFHGNISKKYSYTTSSGETATVKNPFWGFFITTDKDTLAVRMKGGEIFTMPEPVASLEISFFNLNYDNNHQVNLTEHINPYTGDNLWEARVENGLLTLQGGDTGIKKIATFPCSFSVTGFGFFAGWGDKVKVSDISVRFLTEGPDSTGFLGIEDLNDYFIHSDDPMEGYWTIFDRELEESQLKQGGDYKLACVKQGEGYDLIYIDGAIVNSKGWSYGDIKARLQPSPFEGIYNVEWMDAMKQPISHDIRAQRGEGNTLSIQFPYQGSKMRLRKLPTAPTSAASGAASAETASHSTTSASGS